MFTVILIRLILQYRLLVYLLLVPPPALLVLLLPNLLLLLLQSSCRQRAAISTHHVLLHHHLAPTNSHPHHPSLLRRLRLWLLHSSLLHRRLLQPRQPTCRTRRDHDMLRHQSVLLPILQHRDRDLFLLLRSESGVCRPKLLRVLPRICQHRRQVRGSCPSGRDGN